MQELFRIAVVENDELDAQKLQALLKRYFEEKHEAYTLEVFHSAFLFLDDAQKFNLVFMDIEMPGINGMEASFQIREHGLSMPLIVFVTNMAQYAIDGYKVNALDFCLKPITYQDLYLALEKARGILLPLVSKSMMIKTKSEVLQVNMADISCVFMVRHDVHVRFREGDGYKEVGYRGSMRDLDETFEGTSIVRVNSGCFVNLDYFVSYDASDGTCKLKDGDSVPVSRSNRRAFLTALARSQR